MTVNARGARLAVLAAWAALFVTVWATGSTERFLGPRTHWVAPLGAVLLSAAALAYASGAVRSVQKRSELTTREASGLLVLLVPFAAILLVPHGALGSFAASRKADDDYFLRAAPPPPRSPDEIGFLDIRIAEGDGLFAAESHIATGVRVQLIGLTTGSTDVPPGTFELARFYIACCVADAMAVEVPIDATAVTTTRMPRDTWLDVTGTLARRGDRFVVEADAIRRVSRPAHPYLSFRT
jgi:uncharacterized repeat protein (TIGR03943 family)